MFGKNVQIDPKQYIDAKGNFDARAGRVELQGAVRNHHLLSPLFEMARINGLSEVDTLLLALLSMTIAYEDLSEQRMQYLTSAPMQAFVVDRQEKKKS